jgi:hypothetical protein
MSTIDDFQPGVYRHYKGRHYLALGLARADKTDDVVVVYTRLYPRSGLPMSTRLYAFGMKTSKAIPGRYRAFAM